MSMNIQDMAAVMAAKNEAFRGTEQVPEKVTIYNQLRAHAAAIAKTLRTPMHADSSRLSACIGVRSVLAIAAACARS